MPLTVETGAGLADADSLVSLAEVQAYASSRGVTLPVDDAEVEADIRAANDFIVMLENRFQGWRRVATQALPFPRNGLTLYGRYVVDGTIPVTLKNAICQLVIELQTLDILPSAEGRVVVSETVGPISTTYAATGTVGSSPSLPKVYGFLTPLFAGSGLSNIRV